MKSSLLILLLSSIICLYSTCCPPHSLPDGAINRDKPIRNKVKGNEKNKGKGKEPLRYEYCSCTQHNKGYPCLVSVKYQGSYQNDLVDTCTLDKNGLNECGLGCNPLEPYDECMRSEQCVMVFDQLIEDFNGVFLQRKKRGEEGEEKRKGGRFICIGSERLDASKEEIHSTYVRLFGNSRQ